MTHSAFEAITVLSDAQVVLDLDRAWSTYPLKKVVYLCCDVLLHGQR